jgi:HAD superfamily hydrolase (TIGR01493 family)
VIFDFGGVLGLPQDPARVASMASLCGLSVQDFLLAYQRDRLELDRGTLPTHEYWRRIIAIGGVAASADLIARIEREDSLGWTRVNRAMLDWSAELRAAGYRTAILSNMPVDKLTFMRESGEFQWIRSFDPAIFSCDYSIVKPEPTIYRLALDKLRIAPERCLFLDDSPVNVEGARACAIHAMHFRSAVEASDELQERWGLPIDALKGDANE